MNFGRNFEERRCADTGVQGVMKTAYPYIIASGRRHLGKVSIALAVAASSILFLSFGPNGQPRLMAQNDQEKCKPWQYRDDDGDCVDKPDVIHHHGHYEPHSGEQCWVECLCRDGQYPGGDSCSPCSYEGIVCIGH